MRFAALMMLLGLVACESDSTGGEGGSDADRADPTGAPFEENPVIFELSGAPFGEGWQETEEVSTQVSVTVLDPIPELEVSAWGYFVEGEYDFDCGVAFQVKNVSEVPQCDIGLRQFRALQGEGLLGTDADSRIIVFGSVGFTEDETPSNCLAPGETGWAVGELWHLISTSASRRLPSRSGRSLRAQRLSSAREWPSPHLRTRSRAPSKRSWCTSRIQATRTET
jgi:hypothetical protein